MSDKFDVFLTGQLAGDKALTDVINNLAVLLKSIMSNTMMG